MGNKIFLTGSDGFIGGYLIKRLKRKKIDYKTLEGDMRNYNSVVEQISGCDTVVHLAALHHLANGQKFPDLFFDNNVNGTWCVVQASLINKIRKFILTSSLAVQDNRGTTYALTKKVQEEILHTYDGKITNIILRLASVYNTTHGTIGWVLKSKELKIYGLGDQVRDFVHVSDVVDAIMIAIQRNWGNGFTCDIGTGHGISMLDLAKLSGKPFKHVDSPIAEFDPPFTVANPVPAQRIMGFTAKVNYKEYLT